MLTLKTLARLHAHESTESVLSSMSSGLKQCVDIIFHLNKPVKSGYLSQNLYLTVNFLVPENVQTYFEILVVRYLEVNRKIRKCVQTIFYDVRGYFEIISVCGTVYSRTSMA